MISRPGTGAELDLISVASSQKSAITGKIEIILTNKIGFRTPSNHY
jgi:hypothetical protein